MNTEEQDDLWQLLGKARETTATPFFSRNVLRKIRLETLEGRGLRAWLSNHWKAATAVAAGALSIVFFVFGPHSETPSSARMAMRQQTVVPGKIGSLMEITNSNPQADPTMLLAEQVSQSTDYQVIGHLDELLASEESAVWLEN